MDFPFDHQRQQERRKEDSLRLERNRHAQKQHCENVFSRQEEIETSQQSTGVQGICLPPKGAIEYHRRGEENGKCRERREWRGFVFQSNDPKSKPRRNEIGEE